MQNLENTELVISGQYKQYKYPYLQEGMLHFSGLLQPLSFLYDFSPCFLFAPVILMNMCEHV